jgi:ABC-type multidrug transport system fused ATPase/permease subunit
MESDMPIAARIDQFGVLAWIALMVLGFVIWWPLGLITLGFILATGRFWSGNMGYGRCADRGEYKMQKLQWKMDRMRSRMMGRHGYDFAPTSGNRAFDEYRSETLRRLEDEQREFQEFLDRLRFAKDKTEFDEFMAERKSRPEPEAPKGEQRPE